MKTGKIVSLLLAGVLSVMPCLNVHAVTDQDIADAQMQKQAAEANLAATQNRIDDLEGKKYELELYLAELDAKYTELTNVISDLSIQAAEKENELKKIHKDLKKARKAADKQYEAMKLRIVYMYEKGDTSTLELLLSSGSFAEFLNRAENISQISNYDREMLKKYEQLRAKIAEQEEKAETEKTEIEDLMAERSAKKQEVQNLAAQTNENIVAYVNQISATQEEAYALMQEVNNADNYVGYLMQQQAAEEEAARIAAEEEAARIAAEEARQEAESYEEESYEEPSYEEPSYEEESYEEEAYEEPAESESVQTESSGSGTYLGNFKLTAYCNCAQCCGTAGNLTASGTVPTPGRTVAMAGVPFGTKLLINGNVYTVEDLGTAYGHVDIFFNNHSDALSFGLQYADVYQM